MCLFCLVTPPVLYNTHIKGVTNAYLGSQVKLHSDIRETMFFVYTVQFVFALSDGFKTVQTVSINSRELNLLYKYLQVTLDSE